MRECHRQMSCHSAASLSGLPSVTIHRGVAMEFTYALEFKYALDFMHGCFGFYAWFVLRVANHCIAINSGTIISKNTSVYAEPISNRIDA